MSGKLTVRKIETAKQGKYGDGDGLWLIVRPKGKRWIFRYTFNKKRREMGLGSYPLVTLLEARERVMEYRRMVAQDTDPIENRNKEKVAIPTFTQAAARFIMTKRHGWRNAKHRKQWVSTLKTYARPKIGNKQVHEIGTEDILSILSPLWQTKTETAKRVQGRIENILDYAAAMEWRDPVNPARWRGHLDMILPAPSKVATVRQQPALPYDDLPAFMTELQEKKGLSAQALQMLILTATRTDGVLGARWEEIELKKKIWTIPTQRTKTKKRDHRIPLVPHVINILEALPRMKDNPYIFHGQKEGQHLSDMSLLLVMRRMGFGAKCSRGNAVPHGFRSSFRDWIGETTSFPADVAEMALEHSIKNKAEAAYRRGDLFEKRRKMMLAWESFCLSHNASVIALKRGNEL